MPFSTGPVSALVAKPSAAGAPSPGAERAQFEVAMERAADASVPAGSVQPARTPLSREQVRRAIDRAYQSKTGDSAPEPLLDVLTAHVAHETAGGQKMYNFNFGGIKGQSPSGHTARLRTHEYLGGRRVNLRDGFRAYASAEAGASDYLDLIRDRFPQAFARAGIGDVDGFVRELKDGRYFTAPAELYARSMRSHHEGGNDARGVRYAEHLAHRPAESFSFGHELLGEGAWEDEVDAPTRAEIARIFSAMQGSILRIGRPAEVETDGGDGLP